MTNINQRQFDSLVEGSMVKGSFYPGDPTKGEAVARVCQMLGRAGIVVTGTIPDTWNWTNESHTEARNGGWVAGFLNDEDGGLWCKHDDFGSFKSEVWPERSKSGFTPVNVFWDKAEEFSAWALAQDSPKPKEPKGLGAVVERNGRLFTRTHQGEWRSPNGNLMLWDWMLLGTKVVVKSPGFEVTQ